jgi:hypothetical protein
MGRRNWLFEGVPRGADDSAMLFSLMETAKVNEIEPQAYLKFLFERSPKRRAQNACGRSCRSTLTNSFSQAAQSPSRARRRDAGLYRISDTFGKDADV